jgi:hypothetical protein
MANYLIDTNVMMAAKLDPETKIGDLSWDEIVEVYRWFLLWSKSNQGFVHHPAFDSEYRKNDKLNDQDFPMIALRQKMDMQQCDYLYGISFDDNNFAIVPDDFATMDHSDKMWVAAALQNPDDRPIVNCADSDWNNEPLASTLLRYGIQVKALRKPKTAAASELPPVVRAQPLKKKK